MLELRAGLSKVRKKRTYHPEVLSSALSSFKEMSDLYWMQKVSNQKMTITMAVVMLANVDENLCIWKEGHKKQNGPIKEKAKESQTMFMGKCNNFGKKEHKDDIC